MRHSPTILALVVALGGTLAACGGGESGTEVSSTDREPPTATAAGDEGVKQSIGIALGVPAADRRVAAGHTLARTVAQ